MTRIIEYPQCGDCVLWVEPSSNSYNTNSGSFKGKQIQRAITSTMNRGVRTCLTPPQDTKPTHLCDRPRSYTPRENAENISNLGG